MSRIVHANIGHLYNFFWKNMVVSVVGPVILQAAPRSDVESGHGAAAVRPRPQGARVNGNGGA